jgi:hypothetical protein
MRVLPKQREVYRDMDYDPQKASGSEGNTT